MWLARDVSSIISDQQWDVAGDCLHRIRIYFAWRSIIQPTWKIQSRSIIHCLKRGLFVYLPSLFWAYRHITFICIKNETTTPFTRAKKIGTARQIFGTEPRLPVPRLPPEGSLGTPKILSPGATLHVGPIRLYVANWECRALKSSARCQKFAVPCRFF